MGGSSASTRSIFGRSSRSPNRCPGHGCGKLLPAPQHEYEGVRFRGSAEAAVGSFALDVGRLSWYGITDRDAVAVLGLAFTAAGGPVPAACIEPVLRGFDLVVVDWCRCAAIGPDDLTDYLGAVGTL